MVTLRPHLPSRDRSEPVTHTACPAGLSAPAHTVADMPTDDLPADLIACQAAFQDADAAVAAYIDTIDKPLAKEPAANPEPAPGDSAPHKRRRPPSRNRLPPGRPGTKISSRNLSGCAASAWRR